MLTRDRKKKSYDVIITLYDTIKENEYGSRHYATELYQNTTALTLSPNTKWRHVEAEVWRLITFLYGSIDRAEKDDYSVNMSMNYTILDGDKRRQLSKHSNDRAFFGLLARDEITDLELRVNVTYRHESLREHLEKVKARKALQKSSRSSMSSEESVENLKVKKSESTETVKETKTHSCIIQ